MRSLVPGFCLLRPGGGRRTLASAEPALERRPHARAWASSGVLRALGRFVSTASGYTQQSMRRSLLHVYLRDHYAASAGGVALARRALGADHALTGEIARDRVALERVLRGLEVTPSSLKIAGVRVAEWVSRAKLHGNLVSRSRLSDVVELETLLVGVRGKEALWAALLSAHTRGRSRGAHSRRSGTGRADRRSSPGSRGGGVRSGSGASLAVRSDGLNRSRPSR